MKFLITSATKALVFNTEKAQEVATRTNVYTPELGGNVRTTQTLYIASDGSNVLTMRYDDTCCARIIDSNEALEWLAEGNLVKQAEQHYSLLLTEF